MSDRFFFSELPMRQRTAYKSGRCTTTAFLSCLCGRELHCHADNPLIFKEQMPYWVVEPIFARGL